MRFREPGLFILDYPVQCCVELGDSLNGDPADHDVGNKVGAIDGHVVKVGKVAKPAASNFMRGYLLHVPDQEYELRRILPGGVCVRDVVAQSR